MGLVRDAAQMGAEQGGAAAPAVLATSSGDNVGGPRPGAPDCATMDGDGAAAPAGPSAEAETGARAIAAPVNAEAVGARAGGAGRRRSHSTGEQRSSPRLAPGRRRSRTPSSPHSNGRSCTPPQGAPAGNPLDVVFDLLRAAAARPGALVPRRSVELQAVGRGLSPGMLQEALENWCSLNLLDWPGFGEEVGLTAEAWCTQTCHLAPDLPRSGSTDARAGGPCRPVALLPLFDGLGTARLAVQDVLEELGHAEALKFVGYAELAKRAPATCRLRAGEQQ